MEPLEIVSDDEEGAGELQGVVHVVDVDVVPMHVSAACETPVSLMRKQIMPLNNACMGRGDFVEQLRLLPGLLQLLCAGCPCCCACAADWGVDAVVLGRSGWEQGLSLSGHEDHRRL